MTKSSTTPIVMLTLQDLRDVIREEMGSSVNVTHESETPSASQHVPAKLAGKEVVFGLAGICKISASARSSIVRCRVPRN